MRNKPTIRILSRVKQHFSAHWKDVAVELLEHEDVRSIDNSSKTNEEKCFDMLEKWLETSSSPSYLDLIKALKRFNLNHAIEMVKKQVTNDT